ncbi:MAG: metal-dependent hydrolase [Blastocatellia bacterium]
MPLPVAHSLVGATMVTLAMRRFEWKLDTTPLLVGALLGAIPDIDLLLSWWFNFGLRAHGTYTHSILFAVAAGAGVALIRNEQKPRAVAGYVGAALSHGLLDAMTKDQFGGAALLWPFSRHHFRLGLIANYDFYPNPQVQSLFTMFVQAMPYLVKEFQIYLPLLMIALIYRTWPRLNEFDLRDGRSTKPESRNNKK